MNILFRDLQIEIESLREALEYESYLNGCLINHYAKLHKQRKRIIRCYNKLAKIYDEKKFVEKEVIHEKD